MSLTPHQIGLVQSSFSKVEPIAELAAILFYRKLFELQPDLRSLFPRSIEQQGRKLMSVLMVAVGSLTNLPALLPVLQSLGARHVTYGVQPAHYEPLGDALLQTLQTVLGDNYTREVHDAWAGVYTLITGIMCAHDRPEQHNLQRAAG